jgi:hypothetical protein
MQNAYVAPKSLSSERIRIRLDPITRIKLEELARSESMTLGEYVAWVINRFMPPVRTR